MAFWIVLIICSLILVLAAVRARQKDPARKIDDLFLSEEGTIIEIEKKQCIERITYFVLFILGLYICYRLCNSVGEKITSEDFNTGFLYSVFLLPLFYYIKDFFNMFDSCFTEARYSDGCITVRRGFFYRRYDKLYLDDVDNIELYRSFGGRIFGYSSIYFYSFGGFLELPYVKDNKHNEKKIQEIIEGVQEKKN